VREILLAGEEADEGPALLADVIANGSAQHGVLLLQSVQDGALRYWAFHAESNFGANLR
jgi:hypothetical protein